MRASIYHYILVLPFWACIAAIFASCCRILKRLGFRKGWCLLLVVPVANICAIWWLSFSAWPSQNPAYRPTRQAIWLGLTLTAIALLLSSVVAEMLFSNMPVLNKMQRFGALLVFPSCCVLERLGSRKAWSVLHLLPLGSVIALILLANLPWSPDFTRKPLGHQKNPES